MKSSNRKFKEISWKKKCSKSVKKQLKTNTICCKNHCRHKKKKRKKEENAIIGGKIGLMENYNAKLYQGNTWMYSSK